MISVIAEYNGTTRIETHPLNGMSYSILRNNKLPLDQDYIVFLHWLMTA
jgi:hypothetical protein